MYKSKEKLLLIAKEFSEYCNKNISCDRSPNGWEHSTNHQYLGENLMVYKVSADFKSFKIEQKVATGITLVASGGVNQEITVEKIVD
ncbi:hypothetical protein [Moraxella sp. ZY210820]|uniref:hypothetical protein n=1 Tax=unclassified Moraxella TaxID=2685852 RepID=UPI00272FED44|nr:hypothetical protein [Moraxella sp. ZY210820]WLF84453.1 hypothetical protein LU301_02915 [Moraxella sp. ZY210820]